MHAISPVAAHAESTSTSRIIISLTIIVAVDSGSEEVSSSRVPTIDVYKTTYIAVA